jgi:hypothetical protein
MPSDDHPFDALEKQFEMENLSTSSVARAVLGIASLVPFKWPFDKAVEALKGHLAADSLSRIRLMLAACMAEVRKYDDQIRELHDAKTNQHPEVRERISKELLLDAARKAESTRAEERVKRIGVILANAVVGLKIPDADETEEMMRVAMELSDRDIEFLKELVRIEGSLLQARAHIPRYDAHQRWEQGFWGDRVDPEVDSVFSKLESYGLVVRIPPPNNLNITADFQNRYVLLKKGTRFVALVREAAKV